MDEKRRLVWFIFFRVVVVTVLLVTAIILNLEAEGGIHPSQVTVLRLIFATYFFSLGSYLFIRFTTSYTLFLTYLQIIWDIIFVTLLLLVTGGIASPYSFLYFLSIINASILLARREAYYTASLCGILYGAILDFQYFGKLAALGLSPVPARQYGSKFVFSTIFLNFGAFYLTAFLTGYLSERARKSESALEKKAIDLDELERLNRSIVSNLGSGLLTVTNEGRIRVFNRYAQQLTGISHEDAYDRLLSEIIPAMEKYADRILSPQAGEVEYLSSHAGKIVIGFKSVPFNDVEGNRIGAIVNLLDLTLIKQMEIELKKADRLAAIGELSARIAHEIRNPLAAISGSVQLIVQGDSVSNDDKRLLTIAVRETDRLNALISDFLAYARPAVPHKVAVDLNGFVADIQTFLATDHRFGQIALLNECPPGMTVYVDRDQFRQVLLNLLVNAAEEMPSGGTVRLSASLDRLGKDGSEQAFTRIVVEDSGSGMDPAIMARIFEPFFTTKEGGTGLGLATVYRIVESHGGTMHVESTPGAGTRFAISLPGEA
ncbi:MAG: PAS domain-containing sensor histidine kinase [Geobacter sp.]|nr:MAG: PAS domain-containing sensor histidine kinase [Geobacter sp.]